MEIKLLTSNIWADVFGNPVKWRDAALVSVIDRYGPDIVMLQEAHPNWQRSAAFTESFGRLGYAVSRPDLLGNPLNYTPVLYKTDVFTEEGNGFRLFSGPNDYLSKSVSASLLRHRGENRLIGAMSTHFYYAQTEAGNEARMSNAAELAEWFDHVFSGIPCFCGGDFNCDVLSAPFRLLEEHGVRCASTLAAVKKNPVRSHHKNPFYDQNADRYVPAEPSTKSDRRSIDHIVTGGGGVTIREYEVITDGDAMILSDHCPLIITAEL